MKHILFSLLLSAFFSACSSSNQETDSTNQTEDLPSISVELTDAQLANAKLSTTTLQSQRLSKKLLLNGKTEVPPQNMVSISMPLGGFLIGSKLAPGMAVSKGMLLATLEDPQYIQLQEDYLLAKSDLQFATLEYTRQKTLNQSQASSDKVTQNAQAMVETQQIKLKALSEKLKLIHINPAAVTTENISKNVQLRSPINGFVNKVNVQTGQYVNPSEALFELVDPNQIQVHLKAFEKDIPFISIGQKVITFDNAHPEKRYNGAIQYFSKELQSDGTLDITCTITPPYKSLLPNMYMNAELVIENFMAEVLPESAILLFEGKQYVFVQTSPTNYEMVEVYPGLKENGLVEITNAKELTGKKVVNEGAYTLLMKLKNTEE